MVSYEIFEKLEAFEGMTDDHLAALQPHAAEETYRKGDKLFTEGEPATEVWFVLEGQVGLYFEMPDGRPSSSDTRVSSIGEDDWVAKTFGWSCFVPPYTMRLSAYCLSRSCKVVKVSRDGLLKLFKKEPEAGYMFMSHLVRVVGYRFHQFRDEIAKLRGEYLMSGW